jgi:predicted RNase H-like nuclease (RuvC/YqgF family)
MKLFEEHLVEKYEGRFTVEQLVNEGIPKLFLKIEAVKKEIAKLEAERREAVKPWKTEKDPKKKEKILAKLKDLTKKINARQKNLSQMLDMEDKYISQMSADAELDSKMFEDTDLGHQDNEPGMLRADLSTIERYADELGEMMKEFDEMETEIDLPHWWQAKIIKAKDYLVGAKHYLRAELEKTDGILHNKD